MFSEIERLPHKWWENSEIVWEYWDRETYYLWGANKNNYKKRKASQHLSGSGMASSKGPTRGRGHPHYIGIITTSLSKNENEMVFSELESKLRHGATIVIPVLAGRCCLGTGVAFKRYSHIRDWYRSQKRIYEAVLKFASIANETLFSQGVYWPDCGETMKRESTINLSLGSVQDLKSLLNYLKTKAGESH